jgi:UTP-glucose-1-phosphate uridylyltransferase
MISRCHNSRVEKYQDYGARGIVVCERWRSFESFLADMGEKPSPTHSIDRIDVNGNYELSTCRWSTPSEQANNKRGTVRITLDGRTQTLSEWSAETGLAPGTIARRIRAYRWDVRDALTRKPYAKHRTQGAT